MILKLLKQENEELIQEARLGHSWKSCVEKAYNSSDLFQKIKAEVMNEYDTAKNGLIKFWEKDENEKEFNELGLDWGRLESDINHGLDQLITAAINAAYDDAKNIGKNGLGDGKIYHYVKDKVPLVGTSSFIKDFKANFIERERKGYGSMTRTPAAYASIRLNKRRSVKELFLKAYAATWLKFEDSQEVAKANDAFDRKTGVDAISASLAKAGLNFDEVLDWITKHIESINVKIPTKPKNESDKEVEIFENQMAEIADLEAKYPNFKPIEKPGQFYSAWTAKLDDTCLEDAPENIDAWEILKYTTQGLVPGPVLTDTKELTGNAIVKDLVYNLGFDNYLN